MNNENNTDEIRHCCMTEKEASHLSNQLFIGMQAPSFKSNSTFGEIALENYKGKWLVFFSHPGDFTPVCTTEFLAFSSCINKFNDLNTELLGLSVDSNPSHLAWVYSIYKNSGVTIPFPIIADVNGEIAKKYNMLGVVNTSTVRSVYIIDPNGVIRTILTYPKEIGRNISEILRIVKALQVSDENNVVTPANWVEGMPSILKPPTTYCDLEERIKGCSSDSCFDWYLCFKETNNC